MDKVDKERRRFLVAATTLMGGIGAIAATIPFISSWLPSKKTQALGGPIDIDISHLLPGQMMTIEWRGKPVWIIRRTPEMLKHLTDHNTLLRDPNSLVDQQPDYIKNYYRSIEPEYFVVVGVCTHLGCVPLYRPKLGEISSNWPGGFYCPCHASTFDLAGRVFKGVPAPINLLIPPYRFVSKDAIRIGEEAKND